MTKNVIKNMKTETKTIPFSKPYFSHKEFEALREPIESGWVTQGNEIEKFEKSLSEIYGVEHAIAVNSGTSALHLSLLAHNIGLGDEVICPSYTFIATANSIKHAGATPVFSDIDINTSNMTPELTEKHITKKTKAIMVVHQYGFPCELNGFRKLADKHKLLLVQDSACAIGSTYENKALTSWGDISCISFHPRKIITTGEGGAVLTNDEKITEKIKELRSHGISSSNKNKVDFSSIGFNYRLSELNAAVGNVQLQKLEEILLKRREIANKYLLALSAHKEKFAIPDIIPGSNPNYQTLQIRVLSGKTGRDLLISLLANAGISTRTGIPPIHKEIAYKEYKNISLPNTELLSEQGLCLPIYPGLSTYDQDYIIQKVIESIK